MGKISYDWDHLAAKPLTADELKRWADALFQPTPKPPQRKLSLTSDQVAHLLDTGEVEVPLNRWETILITEV